MERNQDLNSLKIHLRECVESITQHSKNGLYVCPLCGSGTGAKRTGAFSIDSSGERWKCFSCNESGDIYDLIAKVEHVTAQAATRIVINRYGDAATEAGMTESRPAPASAPSAPVVHDYAAFLNECAAALPGSPAESYLQARGLTIETMQRFGLGYDAQHQTVTIPYDTQGGYYIQRSINPYATAKYYNLSGATMPLFNAAALYSSAPVVFVVEGAIWAISIMQEGGAAVAISGTGGISKLRKQLESKPTAAALIVCLDNDDAGRKATEEMEAMLSKLGVFCVNGTTAIMGETIDQGSTDYRKDPNEVLQKDGSEVLRRFVADTIETTMQERQSMEQEADEERQERTGAGMVDSFLQAVQTRKYEPLPTGITDIDRALYGGFMRQQLIVLGAAPGVGKTALAQWIFEGIAQKGISSCVYLNLEMSREQILARSLARMAARQGTSINPLQIMQGYNWTEEQRTAITTAAREYKEQIAQRMIYNPDGITTDLDGILAYLEGEARRAEQAQQPAPVVVLDYLQLLTGQSHEDAATVIKRAVVALKGYAIKHNSIVFLIIAHNRLANSTGSVSMEAARDTSAIEYSADLQLALTFTDCFARNGKPAKKPEELTAGERQNVTLRVLKGRFGGIGTDVDLHFNGATMTYTQSGNGFIETNEPTPFTARKRTRF